MRTDTALTQIRAQAPKSDVASAPGPLSAPTPSPEAARDATAILISGRLPGTGAEEATSDKSSSPL